VIGMAALNQQTKTQEVSSVEPGRDRTPQGWDETEPPGTSGTDPVTNGAGFLIYAITAAAVFATTLVNALSAAYDAARRGGVYDPRLPLFWEFSSGVVIVALTPLIDFGVRGIRRHRAWYSKAGWAAATVLLFSALHIAGMVSLRKLALAAFGGSYGFSFAPAELIYEFRKDAVTCFLIGAVFWLSASRRDKDAQQATAAALPASAPPNVLWLRDGPTRIRLEPQDIVMVTSAGNYVEYYLADGRTHLIRGTLAAEEARLAPFGIVRVHRTRLVSLARVSAVQPGPNGDFELSLDTGQTVSGSRRYRSAVVSVVEGASAPAPPPNHSRVQP
jgi:LytTr DNA-binding domain-containing protein